MNILKNLRSLADRKGEKEFVRWALDFSKQHGPEALLSLLRNRVGIPIQLPIDAVWRAWSLHETPAQRQLPRQDRIALWKAGRIEQTLQAERWNKIMDGYKHAIIANNIGSPSSAQHLQIDYVGLGLRDCKPTGIEPAVTDTQLGHEFYRAVPDEIYRSNSSLVVILYLEATQANPTNTTISSVTSTSPPTLVLPSGQISNYQANDVLRINTGSYEIVTVASVNTGTNTLILKTAPALSGTLAPTQPIERGFGECMLFCGNATSTPNSGTAVNHADLRFFKNLETSILVEVHLNYLTGA